MKRTLIALTVSGALTLGAPGVYAQGHSGPCPAGTHGMMGNPLEHLTKELELTPDQQAKAAPIVDQAKPQFQAIHQEAMRKAHAVMENAGAQIRPLLTPQQQAKFDALKRRTKTC